MTGPSPEGKFSSPGVPPSLSDGSYVADETFGAEIQVTGRKSPSMIDAAFAPSLFWDGRADDRLIDPLTGQVVLNSGAALEVQALGPPVSSAEMGH